MKENFRRLVYVPVLHARRDVAQRTSVLRESGPAGEPASGNGGAQPELREMWAGIAAKIAEFRLPWGQMRIYQDGLPVCGGELRIVEQLAAKGSFNHQLILSFVRQGAKLEGTENMDLLLKEYDLLSVLLMRNTEAGPDSSLADYQAKSRELLKARDAFILNRIRATLRQDETPLVFMGVMHRLDKLLEQEFFVSCVIYRLPFRTVGAIYNA